MYVIIVEQSIITRRRLTMWKAIAFKLVDLGIDYLIGLIDSDKDGKIDREELEEFSSRVQKKIKSLKSKLKK